jgi:hypothetical protein
VQAIYLANRWTEDDRGGTDRGGTDRGGTDEKYSVNLGHEDDRGGTDEKYSVNLEGSRFQDHQKAHPLGGH